MRILALILSIAATVTAQNVVPLPHPGSILPQVEQQEFAPVQPLTPFNVASDGFYGYQPYPNAVPLPQQAPLNNFAPVPYQYPIGAYPHPVYPNYPNLGYPQFPGFPQFPQLFPQFPSPFQPAVHPVFQPNAIPQEAPQPNSAALAFANYQGPQVVPPQQLLRPASVLPQGVNGLQKPVSTPYVNSNSNNIRGYGSAYGMYAAAPAAVSPNQGARYEAVSGDTVHTASLPGHTKDYKVMSGQAVPVLQTPATGKQ